MNTIYSNVSVHVKQLWDVIQPTGDYECAHLRADGVFNGCILNFIHASDVCPTAASSRPLAPKDATSVVVLSIDY